MTNAEQITTVSIYGHVYNIKSGGDPEYVKELAAFVDEKMREVTHLTPTVDTLRVAVLAALNISDELLSTREKLQDLETHVDRSSERIFELLKPFTQEEEEVP